MFHSDSSRTSATRKAHAALSGGRAHTRRNHIGGIEKVSLHHERGGICVWNLFSSSFYMKTEKGILSGKRAWLDLTYDQRDSNRWVHGGGLRP